MNQNNKAPKKTNKKNKKREAEKNEFINSYCDLFLKERISYATQWRGLSANNLDTESIERINNMLILDWLKRGLNPWTGKKLYLCTEEER